MNTEKKQHRHNPLIVKAIFGIVEFTVLVCHVAALVTKSRSSSDSLGLTD